MNNTLFYLLVAGFIGATIYLIRQGARSEKEKSEAKLKAYYNSLGDSGVPARALMRAAGYNV